MFEKLFGNNEPPKQNNKDKTMKVIVSRCPQNHPCPSIKVCPVGAIEQSGYKAPTINMDKCIKCGKCAKFCPMRALVME